jgi:predicted dehydrogenase
MTLRVGIVGWGRWAPNLARNLAKHCTVSWVCDPSEAAQQRARDAGYVSCNAPLWDECDAVAIATPIATHKAIVFDTLHHEKHVLCEKPLAVRASDARVLADCARDFQCVLFTSAPWLYHPAIQRAAAIAPELGAPLWFRATRTSWDERPLDPLADLLPHDVGIMQAWGCGPVREVSAMVNGPTAGVTLMTERGVMGTIQYSYRDKNKRRDVFLGSERGVLRCDVAGLTTWTDVATDSYFLDQPEPLDAMCAEFVACIREGRAPKHGNVDAAIHVAAVIEAAHRSVAERRLVSL